MQSFDFNELFILDLANNHQGDLDHGLNIIRALGGVVREEQLRAAIKFQFRQIDTFIHPAYRTRQDVKHIPRFIGTRLTPDEYERLLSEVANQGLVSMCTPFDEESVDLILDMGIDVIKIASCSALDQPLLDRIAQTERPVICSTAGLTVSQIDHIVQFFRTKKNQLALEHCVAIYPTPADMLNLNQITALRKRYPDLNIGWSTHEDPEDYNVVQVAYAKGATLFERHVGMETDRHKLNTYSSTPEQIRNWLRSYKMARQYCGPENRPPAAIIETESLKSLKRGTYARHRIGKGSPIARDDVYFAMPALDGVLLSDKWRDDLVADRDYEADEGLGEELAVHRLSDSQIIFDIILQVKGMINDARIPIGRSSKIELSHHYGLHRFREFGAVIIDVINRAYCKKLIVQLPRQKHPYHHHKKKEESFQILYGDLEIEKNGVRQILGPGDVYLVEPEHWHKFSTMDGVIFEEISTTHYNDDSYYQDEMIAKIPREKRKTIVDNWEFIEQ